jgi:hypothetical protein
MEEVTHISAVQEIKEVWNWVHSDMLIKRPAADGKGVRYFCHNEQLSDIIHKAHVRSKHRNVRRM